MNIFFITKILISAFIIAIVSEIAKKYTLLGGLIVAMPITTLLSIIWIYLDKKDPLLISNFLISVVYGTILSFLFFICAIFFLKKGVNFYLTLFISLVVLGIGAYFYQKFIKLS
jgi:hypothetical protein